MIYKSERSTGADLINKNTFFASFVLELLNV